MPFPPGWGSRLLRHQPRALVGWSMLVLAFLFVVAKGTFAAGARDIDTRYFFVAGRVWLHGHSPYDFAHYQVMWRRYFQDDIFPGGFAYFPGATFYSVPLGAAGWPLATVVFRALNLGAVLVILSLCLSYVRGAAGGDLGLRHHAWIAFGIAMGGVPGTILTGQSTVMVSAACLVVAVLSLRLWPLLFLALLVASSKPQIAGPVLTVVLIADVRARRTLLAGALVVALVSASVLALDASPVAHLMQAVAGNANLGVNGSGRMIGLGPLLAWSGLDHRLATSIGWLALATVVALIARKNAAGSAARAEKALTRRDLPPLALMAGFLCVGLAYPYHDYDTAIFAPSCGLAGLLSRRRQIVLLPIFALIGRPRLVSWVWGPAGSVGAAENRMVSLLWLAALVTVVAWKMADSRREALETREGAGSQAMGSGSMG